MVGSPSCSGCRHSYCPFKGSIQGKARCTYEWERDLETIHSENNGVPQSIKKYLRGLSMEVKKKIFPLDDWWAIRFQEFEYGDILSAVQGNENDNEVLDKKEELLKIVKSVIHDVRERYGEIVEGRKPEKKPAMSSVNYTAIRYGKDL